MKFEDCPYVAISASFIKIQKIVLVIFDKQLKFGYSEKATQFEKIFHLKFDVTENFKWKIFSNFLAFSEYPNFNTLLLVNNCL